MYNPIQILTFLITHSQTQANLSLVKAKDYCLIWGLSKEKVILIKILLLMLIKDLVLQNKTDK